MITKKIFNLFLYLGRYFSFLKENYYLDKKINFGSRRANKFFISELTKTKSYFEIGSGNSTFYAVKLKKKYLSVEADRSFYNYMKNYKLKNIFYSDLGPTKYFSYPIIPVFLIKEQIKNYAQTVNLFIRKYNTIPELILIDGRFRAYCVLSILKIICNSKYHFRTKIIIDDYKSRKDYRVLNTIIKVKITERFGVIDVTSKTKLDYQKIDKLKKNKINNFI
tara:strand:- start:19 stop:681 length:663 start_codon:yes stop_codon:yes gene_type:complete